LAAMDIARSSDHGMAIGAWGAVQATSIGAALAIGGLVRDGVNTLINSQVGEGVLVAPVAGYSVVYHIEIGLLFAALVIIGPLVGHRSTQTRSTEPFGLAELPG
ncbi:MAG: PucC family protein, partial [Pseudomonadota bacterium]